MNIDNKRHPRVALTRREDEDLPEITAGFLGYDFFPPVGGQGVVSHSLYQAFQGDPEIDVFAMSSRENDIAGHTRVPTGVQGGLGPVIFSVKSTARIRSFIRDRKIDILQVDGGPGGVILMRDPGIPVVYVAHHTYAQQYEYLGRKFKYRVLKALEGHAYGYSSHMVAVSTTTKESLVGNYGFPPDVISVVPNGIDRARFRPLDREREPESMLFVGRLCERKGLTYLVGAMETVIREIPGIKLYIIGEGELRQPLERRASELGLTGNIIFEGRASEDELVEWYNRVELFVLPSLFEGFGIVCLEAMSCGTPVIATRTPGIVDIVSDTPPCALVPPGDEAQLAGAVIKYFREHREKPGMWSGIGDEYDWKSIAGKYKKVYEQVLSRS